MASLSKKDAPVSSLQTETVSEEQPASPKPFPMSPITTEEPADTSNPQTPSRILLTPPVSPSRNRVRRLTGSPYSRSRTTSGSNKSKAHHIISSSGDEPITHPGVRDNVVEGVRSLPVEYSDRFECYGGVNVATLLRATRRTMLENIANLGANALADEKWDCTICGPKQGTYKVQVHYFATAIRCSRPDGFRPVALDKAKNIPGLMTITKRNEEY